MSKKINRYKRKANKARKQVTKAQELLESAVSILENAIGELEDDGFDSRVNTLLDVLVATYEGDGRGTFGDVNDYIENDLVSMIDEDYETDEDE